jgi:hypothetical protein
VYFGKKEEGNVLEKTMKNNEKKKSQLYFLKPKRPRLTMYWGFKILKGILKSSDG